jgi:hypothetical protein
VRAREETQQVRQAVKEADEVQRMVRSATKRRRSAPWHEAVERSAAGGAMLRQQVVNLPSWRPRAVLQRLTRRSPPGGGELHRPPGTHRTIAERRRFKHCWRWQAEALIEAIRRELRSW